MLSKNIVVGTEYADQYGRRITAVGVASNSEVQVERAGRTTILRVKDVKQTWSEYLADEARAAEARQNSLDRRNENVRRIKQIAGDSTPSWITEEVCRDGSYATERSMDVRSLRILLDVAFKAGAASVSA